MILLFQRFLFPLNCASTAQFSAVDAQLRKIKSQPNKVALRVNWSMFYLNLSLNRKKFILISVSLIAGLKYLFEVNSVCPVISFYIGWFFSITAAFYDQPATPFHFIQCFLHFDHVNLRIIF
jgi:hypothetical protein